MSGRGPAPRKTRARSANGAVVFVGEFLFPNGDAAAVRTLSLARMCRDLEYEVIVIGKGTPRESDRAADGHYYIEGIRYISIASTRHGTWQRITRLARSMRQFPTAIERLGAKPMLAVIVNACDSARHVPFLRSYCARRGVPLVADVCEWYDPRHRAGKWANPFYLVFAYVFARVLPRIPNLIVVSSLLEHHFRRHLPHLCRIAAPVDVLGTRCEPHRPLRPIVVMYAGMPGKKDLIAEVVHALVGLEATERALLQLRLYGVSESDLLDRYGILRSTLANLGESLRAFGRVPHATVVNAYREAHFTILFRPSARYANAGFPSKVAESLAAGVPLLGNVTTDLAEYVPDGTGALYAAGCTVPAIADAFRRILTLDSEQLTELRRGAREAALRWFDYRSDLPRFAEYLGHLRQSPSVCTG